MNLLLDTSVFLWALASPEKLNRKTRELLTRGRDELFFSAASSWEIALKFSRGKLEVPESPTSYVPRVLREFGVRTMDVTSAHALAVIDLPWHHRDPFDRILVAQARLEKLTLATADDALEGYDVDMLWCGV